MLTVHLTSSTFYGGPERQMLGLAHAIAPRCRTAFLSFPEGGRSAAFVEEVRRQGFEADSLTHDTPRVDRAVRELIGRLGSCGAAALFCHGYKADILGQFAARRVGIPVVAVSRGWTGENRKVRLYERLDRLALRWVDRVVCVSDGQAAKVRRAGVPGRKVTVIRNAIRADRFGTPNPAARAELLGYFPTPPARLVGAVGRLSPEKGFDLLIDAAATVLQAHPSAGFVLFGEGPCREELTARIAARGLTSRFVLGGFRRDLDRLLPDLNLLVQSSHTEGLPNALLEAFASGVPVVATAVGGTAELVDDGVSGHLVPPNDADRLAVRMTEVLSLPDSGRRGMGQKGRQRVLRDFTFAAQADQYLALIESLVRPSRRRGSWFLSRSLRPAPGG